MQVKELTCTSHPWGHFSSWNCNTCLCQLVLPDGRIIIIFSSHVCIYHFISFETIMPVSVGVAWKDNEPWSLEIKGCPKESLQLHMYNSSHSSFETVMPLSVGGCLERPAFLHYKCVISDARCVQLFIFVTLNKDEQFICWLFQKHSLMIASWNQKFLRVKLENLK